MKFSLDVVNVVTGRSHPVRGAWIEIFDSFSVPNI